MAGLEALIVDYGDVLSGPQRAESVEAMARRVGVSVDAFAPHIGNTETPTTRGSQPKSSGGEC